MWPLWRVTSSLIRSRSEKRVAPLRFGWHFRLWSSIPPLVLIVLVVAVSVLSFVFASSSHLDGGGRPTRSLLYRGLGQSDPAIRPVVSVKMTRWVLVVYMYNPGCTCTQSRESKYWTGLESNFWTGLESKFLDRSVSRFFSSRSGSASSWLRGGGGRLRARSLDADLRVGEV